MLLLKIVANEAIGVAPIGMPSLQNLVKSGQLIQELKWGETQKIL
jgi:hypothetical protein